MSNDWIDAEGFRANVGIIIANAENQLLLGGRVGAKGWQFPQGGMLEGEDPRDAMYRELHEEVGLEKQHVEILGQTQSWVRYRLPDKLVRRNKKPLCVGQKQIWFLLRLVADESNIRFDRCEKPEFDRYRWVRFWRPVNEVIYFKRRVYALALHELGVLLHDTDLPARPRWWPKRWVTVFDKDLQAADLERLEDGQQDDGEEK